MGQRRGWKGVFGILLLLSAASIPNVVSQTAFPGNTTGHNIGGQLNQDGLGTTEPSGLVWQPRMEKLYVVHDGNLIRAPWAFELSFDGVKSGDWEMNASADLEAVAYQDSDDSFVWFGQERSLTSGADIPKIFKFYFETTGQISRGSVGATIDLKDTGTNDDCGLRYTTDENKQMEGLTYVPTDDSGTFWAGKEQDGKIYEFTLSGTTVGCDTGDELDPVSLSNPSIGALEYTDIDDVVYAMYKDGHNITYELTPSGSQVTSWDNPSRTDGQNEGLAVKRCHAFYAVDYGGTNSAGHNQVWRHDFNLDCTGSPPEFPCVRRHEEEKSLCGFGTTCQGAQMLRANSCLINDALVDTPHGSALVFGPTTDGYPSAYSFIVNNSGSAGTRWLTVLNGAYSEDRLSTGRIKLNGSTLLDTTDITSSVGWVETTFTLPAGNSTLTIDNTTTVLGTLSTLITDEAVKP